MDSITTIGLIALSLALDSFTVSIAGGLNAKKAKWPDAIKVGLYFGVFQAVMPLIGWLIGDQIGGRLQEVSGWIALALLSFIGLKMIKESLGSTKTTPISLLGSKTLLLMSLATSIDALVVGFTINLIDVPLTISLLVIGAVAFSLSVLGFMFGKKIGSFFSRRIGFVGGLVLIMIGLKIFLES